MRVSPILHIGSPKTASASLQEAVVPRLDRPYLINPSWMRRFTRDVPDAVPSHLPLDVVISDVTLGDFAVAPPALIADRLARLCGGGTVIYVRRDPLELFYALYRQKLLDSVSNLRVYLKGPYPLRWPFSPSDYFSSQHRAFKQRGLGIFAMISINQVRRAFERHFDVHTIEFNLLRTDAAAFVRSFMEACDADLAIELPITNVSSADRMAAALAPMAAIMPPRLINRLMDYYGNPSLKPNQEHVLKNWMVQATDADVSWTPADLDAIHHPALAVGNS